MKLRIITSHSGDWGVAFIDNLIIDSGHHVKYNPLIEAICLSADIELITETVSDREMEENY